MKTLLDITLIAAILFHNMSTRFLLIEVEDSDQLPKAPGGYENKFNEYLKVVIYCFTKQ